VVSLCSTTSSTRRVKGKILSERLTGKVAVVTGAGRGIGREYALALAREGAAVVVNDLPSSDPEAVVAELQALGAGGGANHADVTDPDAVDALMTQAVDQFGGLDIVIANAGIIDPQPIEQMPGAAWARVIAVHVNGTFNCIHSAIPHLRSRGGGSIVTTGSIARELLFPGLASYRAAKAAIVVLNDYAAAELREANINVNTIMPGATVTRMSQTFYESLAGDRSFLESAARRRQGGTNGAPEPAPAETVPPLGVFLCTEEGRAITGHAFQMSGVKIGYVKTSSEFVFLEPTHDHWTLEELGERLPEWIAQTAAVIN
jgi:NAD(P)-dependent dehydrogenase (short-subunit alcohol dehydrogenase family)